MFSGALGAYVLSRAGGTVAYNLSPPEGVHYNIHQPRYSKWGGGGGKKQNMTEVLNQARIVTEIQSKGILSAWWSENSELCQTAEPSMTSPWAVGRAFD